MAKRVNKLLIGEEGLSMKDDAFDMAREIIGCENLETHPDFIYLTLGNSAKSIGVEDIYPLLAMGTQKPVLSPYSVVVIDYMDTLTVQAQNKLLLTLESSPYLVMIGICYKDNLRPTVKSRMQIVHYRPLPEKAFMEYLGDEYEPDIAKLLFFATNGCPGKIRAAVDHVPLFRKVYELCSKGNISELFSVFHLIQEKDSACIFQNRNLVESCLRIMAQAYVEKTYQTYLESPGDVSAYIDISYKLLDAAHSCRNPQYSQADFFYTIMYVLEGEKKYGDL